VNRMTSSEPQGIQKSVLALMLIYVIFVFGRHWVRFIYEHEGPTQRVWAQGRVVTPPLQTHVVRGDKINFDPTHPGPSAYEGSASNRNWVHRRRGKHAQASWRRVGHGNGPAYCHGSGHPGCKYAAWSCGLAQHPCKPPGRAAYTRDAGPCAQ
jgi:hypothetical protein